MVITPVFDGTATIQKEIQKNGITQHTGTATITVHLPIDEGTYYFKNKDTGNFLQIDDSDAANDYSTTGAGLELHDFDTGDYQRWQLVHVYSGYYYIRSVSSGKSISVQENNTNVGGEALAQEQFVGLTRQMWKFTKTNHGTYIVRSQSGEGYSTDWCMCADDYSNSPENISVEQNIYVNDSDYKDEWEITIYSFLFSTLHYYDQGYNIRFSTSSQSALTAIQSYQSEVSNRFLSIFSIEILPQYIYYTSSADECKISTYGLVEYANLTANCPHFLSHLSTTALRDLLSDGTCIMPKVLWTGHILTGNPSSNSNSNRNSIVITPKHTTLSGNAYINKPDSDIYRESVYTLMHEMSHQLGAKDHYCYNDNGTDPCSNPFCDKCYNNLSQPRSCIMSYRYDISSLSDDDIYCEDCVNRILSHLNSNH